MIRFLLTAAVALCCATAEAQYRYCHVQKRFVPHQLAVVRQVEYIPFYAANYSAVGVELRNAAIAREVASLLRAEQQPQHQQQQSPAYAVLERNCVQCHNQANRSGGLSLVSQSGQWGELNWAGIYERVRTHDAARRMPPGGQLGAEDILAIADHASGRQAVSAPRAVTEDCGPSCDKPAEVMDAEQFAAEIERIVNERVQAALGEAGLQTAEQRGRGVFIGLCVSCHSGQPDRPAFADADGNLLELSVPKLVSIYGAAKLGSMPPPLNAAGQEVPPLSDNEFRDLEAWLKSSGLPSGRPD